MIAGGGVMISFVLSSSLLQLFSAAALSCPSFHWKEAFE